MAPAVLNASDTGDLGRSQRPSSEHTPPSSILRSYKQGLKQRSSQVLESVFKYKRPRATPLNAGTSYSTSHSATISFRSNSEIFHVALPYIALLLIVFLAYWYSAADDTEVEDITVALAQKSNGPWARAYREAKGSRRQAIDFLVRCSIVSHEEFTSDTVDNERIDSFCWVAVNMLMQQSVENWLRAGGLARQAFDKNFKASFSGRSPSVSEVGDSTERSCSSSRPDIPKLNLPTNKYGQVTQLPAQQQASSAASVDEDSSSCVTTSREVEPSQLSPPNSMILFEQPPTLPSEGALGASLRSLPLHLLGPSPTVFGGSGRGIRRAGRGTSGSGRGSSASSRTSPPKAQPSQEPVSRQKSPGSHRSQPAQLDRVQSRTSARAVLDCSPAPAAKAPQRHLPVMLSDSLEGAEDLLSATPVASATQGQGMFGGEVDRAG